MSGSFLPDYGSDAAVKAAEQMKHEVSMLLRGIDRYNPENLPKLEKYVEMQANDQSNYDLEANLAILKLYQFNPTEYKQKTVEQILLKALANLPHTDFVLCKCLIDLDRLQEPAIDTIVQLHRNLERCQFQSVWGALLMKKDLLKTVKGLEDSIRRFVCYVVNMTYQKIDRSFLSDLLNVSVDQLSPWMTQYNWHLVGEDTVFIANQENIVKSKNILEKIEFDSVERIMQQCR